jgi:hypothetical protein
VVVDSLHSAKQVLKVRCSGTIGIGSESVSSMRPLANAVAAWLRSHPDQSVREIVVDFTDVEYRWGDAPVSCLLPFIRQGVDRVRFLASGRCASALEGLFAATNMHWFSIEQVDA